MAYLSEKISAAYLVLDGMFFGSLTLMESTCYRSQKHL